MMEYLDQLIFWHWLILGVVLIALEILVPGFIAMWIGIAAILTGGLLFLAPNITWEYQLLIFAVLSAISLYVGRQIIARKPQDTDHPALNRRGEGYVGKSFVLSESIQNGVGKLVIDDTSWRTSGADMPKGTLVKVVRMDGSTLVVEKDTSA